MVRRSTGLQFASFAVALCLIAADGEVHGQNSVGQMEAAFVKTLPDGPGKTAFVRVCGGCHGVDEIGVVALSRKGWESKVDEMFRAGAVGTDEDVLLLLDYLSATFRARLDINRANTMDFRRYLSLSEEEGDTIVAYRRQHGPFKRWQDLAVVPGIDFRKITDRQEILVVDPRP